MTSLDKESAPSSKVTLYRMVMDKHVCPYGLKAKHLLMSKNFEVDDRLLTTKEETEAFKQEHQVSTTPQVFINQTRVGGYEELRKHLGLPVADKNTTSYQPIIALLV